MAKMKKGSSKMLVAGEIGAVALAAAGAGYYFYASKDAKKHRKAATKWAENLRTDVVKEAKSLKTLDAKTVAMIVDESVAAYKKMGSADGKELARAASELKANWHRLAVAKLPAVTKAKKQMKKAMAPAKRAIKKVAKKAIKKVSKKSRK
jgi:hypothetical protein